VARVLAERDRRAVVPPHAQSLWRGSWYSKEGSWEQATAFVADVWAATVLLEIQLGNGRATPTRVAEWLISNGRDHGYTASSLRSKVYQARERITVFERHHEWWTAPIWETFTTD
jgi:hypothetical protein